MRELRVIGFTSDHGGLILAAKRGADTESFLLALDDDLASLVVKARQHAGVVDAELGLGAGEGATAGPGADRTGVVGRPGRSGLTPREIQARLRSGRTVGEVAMEAGVGTDWIDRFAAPVLAEQAAVVARALAAKLHTPRRGHSERMLEASVQRNLADRGIMLTAEEFDSAWSAAYLLDNEWLLRFRFVSKSRPSVAEWVYDMSSGALISRSRLATELGFVDAVRHDPAVPALFDLEDDTELVAEDRTSPKPRPPRRADPGAKPRRGVTTKKVAATARLAGSGPAVRGAVPAAGERAPEGGGVAGPPAGDQPGGAV